MKLKKGDLVNLAASYRPKNINSVYLVSAMSYSLSLDLPSIHYKVGHEGVYHSGWGIEQDFTMYSDIFGEEDAI